MGDKYKNPFGSKEMREGKDFKGILKQVTLNVEQAPQNKPVAFRDEQKPDDIHFVHVDLGGLGYDGMMTNAHWEMIVNKSFTRPQDVEVNYADNIAQRRELMPSGYKQVVLSFETPGGKRESIFVLLSEVDRDDLKSKIK